MKTTERNFQGIWILPEHGGELVRKDLVHGDTQLYRKRYGVLHVQ